MRDRPEFPAPAALGANANPAARDVFKRATAPGRPGLHAQHLSVLRSSKA